MSEQIGHEDPSFTPEPARQPTDPWRTLSEQPGFAESMRRGLDQQRREVPGTPAGERWKAWVKAHPGEF